MVQGWPAIVFFWFPSVSLTVCLSFNTLFADLRNCTALVVFEYIITFGTEVQLFWGRRVTGASILFFINRYMRLAYALLCVTTYLPISATALVSPCMHDLSDRRSQNS